MNAAGNAVGEEATVADVDSLHRYRCWRLYSQPSILLQIETRVRRVRGYVLS